MNTKTTKFLAVLAVLAMAFVALAIAVPGDEADADDPTFVAEVTIGETTTQYETVKAATQAAYDAGAGLYEAKLIADAATDGTQYYPVMSMLNLNGFTFDIKATDALVGAYFHYGAYNGTITSTGGTSKSFQVPDDPNTGTKYFTDVVFKCSTPMSMHNVYFKDCTFANKVANKYAVHINDGGNVTFDGCVFDHDRTWDIGSEADDSSSIKFINCGTLKKVELYKPSSSLAGLTTENTKIEELYLCAPDEQNIVLDADYSFNGIGTVYMKATWDSTEVVSENAMTLTIEEDCTLTVPEGTMIYPQGATITNNGTISFADISQLIEVEGDGEILIAGEEKDVETSEETEVTPENFPEADDVVFTGAVETIEVPEGKGAVLKDITKLTEVTINEKAEVYFEASETTQDITLKNNAQATEPGEVVLKAGFSGKVTLTYGSVYINGVEMSGDIEVSGSVKISGSLDGTVNLIATADATIIVEDGATLDLNGKNLNLVGSVGKKISFNNEGSIIGYGIIDVNEFSQFYSSNPVNASFTGKGEIDLDDATEKVYLSGVYTSTNTYNATQEVIVNGNLTIMSGAYIIIEGGFEVLEGVTVTIQDGAFVKLQSVTAYADIDGTIRSNAENGFEVDTTVDGDVIIDGAVIAAKASTDDATTVKISGKVELTGTLTVNVKAVAEFGQLYVKDGGMLIDNGTIKGQFYNESEVTINGKVDGTTTIYMFADDATVNIVALTDGDLVITDNGAYLGKDGGEKYVGTDDNPANWIEFSEIAGIVVSENIYSYTYNNEKIFVNQTLLSGDATKATSTSVAAIYVTAGTATVAEELSLLKADMIVELAANLYVSGAIYADNAATEEYELTIDGAMTVTGLVRSTEIIDSEAGINAVRFTSVLLATTFYNYTTLATAIEAEAKDITVLGDLYVNTNTTIPAGMEIDASNSDVYIGVTMDGDDTSVILTVAKGGYLSAKKIDVRGTLFIENADTDLACNNIISDTYATDDVSALYTNIYTALDSADAGDVVKITNKDGTVELKKNATVGSGVTLVIPASKELVIADKITLTVEGVIENKGTISAENDFAEEATDETSAIALSGVGLIQSSTAMAYDDFAIPGAYFTYKTLSCITTVDGAQVWIAVAEDRTIDIYGSEIAFGTVIYAGESEEEVAIVNVHSDMVSGTVTLSDAKIVIDEELNLDVTIAGADGIITFAGVKTDAESTIATVTDDDGITVLTVTAGEFVENGDSKLSSKKTTLDGIVEIYGTEKITLYKPTFKGVIAIESTVEVTGAATVSGVLAVGEGTTVTMKDNLTVSGSMVVGHDSKVKVEEAKKSITVTGSIIAAEKDEDGGKATVTTVTLTTGSNDYAGADAVISGDVSADYYKVYDGTTFEGKIAETLADLKDEGKYTEFNVHGALWFTYLYSDSAAGLDPIVEVDEDAINYNYQPKGLVDSVFSAWQKKDSSGKLVTITTNTAVGGVKAVYALIDYNIYDITIKTDAGIKSVSIDGIVMVNTTGNNVFDLAGLAAGTHKVSYELKSGYSGTAVLSTSTGTILKDNSFALSGTEVTEFTFQLAGTEPTPEPEPVTPEEKSEWTITTILLCILVVLIAIMAVIVALRLNRN